MSAVPPGAYGGAGGLATQAAGPDPEEALRRLAAVGGDGVAEVLGLAEDRMLELAGQFGDTLGIYARETISAGGKRLRPLLVCLASGVPVRRSGALIRAACAVELIHSATLVHDDVLDASPLRRGRPTVFAQGGRLMATAVGDLLFSRAFWELAGGGEVAPVQILAQAARSLASGELLQRADAFNISVTVERYLERCRLKTAELFRAACELGALAGGAGECQAEALGHFGESIGLAFQLFDDLLDVTGPPERTGKPRGADLLDGTVTLPLLLAIEEDRTLADLDLREIRTAVQAAQIADRISQTGALEEVQRRALAMIAAAKAQLPLLEAAQRAALELVADGVVERYC
jgi:geranylgeranyl pyrophosphate synthase